MIPVADRASDFTIIVSQQVTDGRLPYRHRCMFGGLTGNLTFLRPVTVGQFPLGSEKRRGFRGLEACLPEEPPFLRKSPFVTACAVGFFLSSLLRLSAAGTEAVSSLGGRHRRPWKRSESKFAFSPCQ